MVFYKSGDNISDSDNSDNDNDTIENFTSTLQEFKNKEKFKSISSNLNSPNLKRKNKKKKEAFKEDDYTTFDDYKEDFKSYKFTRKTKSSLDALNKMEFYIEKFKELW